mgnify:FL=1
MSIFHFSFVVIRLINLLDKTIVEEKFLIKIYSKDKKLGEKIVRVMYRPDDQQSMSSTTKTTRRLNVSSSKDHDYFHDLSDQPNRSQQYDDRTATQRTRHNSGQKLPNQYLIWTALIICLIILMLPHDDESNYSYLQIGVNVKICSAYILGLVTVLLIRN